MKSEDLKYLINKKNSENSIRSRRNAQPEAKLQMAVIRWIRKNYPDVITIVCPITKLPGSKLEQIKRGAIRKKMGYMAGTPDLFLPEPTQCFKGLFIELKIDGNGATDKQLSMLDSLQRRGYYAVCCCSYDEAIKTIKSYLNKNV